jgi:hypothetical protein
MPHHLFVTEVFVKEKEKNIVSTALQSKLAFGVIAVITQQAIISTCFVFILQIATNPLKRK